MAKGVAKWIATRIATKSSTKALTNSQRPTDVIPFLLQIMSSTNTIYTASDLVHVASWWTMSQGVEREIPRAAANAVWSKPRAAWNMKGILVEYEWNISGIFIEN